MDPNASDPHQNPDAKYTTKDSQNAIDSSSATAINLNNNVNGPSYPSPTTSNNCPSTVLSSNAAGPCASAPTPSKGYYNAEKCRAHIAHQIKVNKIERFAAQVLKAIEIESSMQSRLVNLMNIFGRCSARVVHDFTSRCKASIRNHRQDRTPYKRRRSRAADVGQGVRTKGNPIFPTVGRLANRGQNLIPSNELLQGPGLESIFAIFDSTSRKHKSGVDEATKPQQQDGDVELASGSFTEEECYRLSDTFDPGVYVRQLEDLLRANLRQSRLLQQRLTKMRHFFERLATEHRNQVDLVYAAEEERQSASVVRRSAYILSMAAFKATTTPVHVAASSNND